MTKSVIGVVFAVLLVGTGFATDVRADTSIPLPLHETRVITLTREQPAPEETRVPVSVNPAGVLTILTEPVFLPKGRHAYLRVRGESAGKTVVSVDGKTFPIEVAENLSPARHARERPIITAPAEDAVGGDRIDVGVEIFSEPNRALGEGSMVLETSDGQTLKPVETWEAVDGPFRRFRFEFTPKNSAFGPISFTAVMKSAAGVETRSEARHCRLIGDETPIVASGECESLREVERTERYPGTPAIAFDASASEGRFVRMTGKRPALLIPIAPEHEGFYALSFRARGELGGGTFPSLLIARGEKGEKVTTARVIGSQWHHIVGGQTIALKPGKNILVVELGNELRLKDVPTRSLDLDRFELRYLGPKKPSGNFHVRFGDDQASELVNGPVTVRGHAFHKGGKPAGGGVTVSLWINGQETAQHKGAEATFRLTPSQLQHGPNTVQLRAARPDGATAESEVRTWHLPKDASREEPAMDLVQTRTLPHAPEWKMNRGAVVRENVTEFHSESDVTVPLPADVVGDVAFAVEIEGDHYKGAPLARVELLSDGRTVPIGEVAAGKSFRFTDAGTAPVRGGTNALRVSFMNDAYDAGQGDRNLRLRQVRATVRSMEDTVLPTIAVDYPKPEAKLGTVDAVVARVYDNAGVAEVQLLWNGEPHGPPLAARERGPLLIPFLMKGAAKKGGLAVRVTDNAGNRTQSAPIAVQIAPGEGKQLTGAFERAVRLLQRFAYGPESAELARVLTFGETAWLETMLQDEAAVAREPAAVLFPEYNDRATARRGLREALDSSNPVRIRFGFWAGNHFSTWIRKVGATPKWREHEAFTNLGIAPFFDLLETSATSPAMLNYLDQRQSFAGKINENYAREIMELHTLGVHGGYTQEDVTEAAHLLTGWTSQDDADPLRGGGDLVAHFRFEPFANSGEARRTLGLGFPATAPDLRFDRVRNFLEMLAWHPSTARFISTKLAEHYVGQPAPEKLVDELAANFLQTGGDMKTLLRGIAVHSDFWRRDLPARIAPPLDYGLRLARLSGSRNAQAIDEMMANTGKALFDCASPDGYPDDDSEYADSNFMLQKWRFAQALGEPLAGLVPPALWRGGPTDEKEQDLIDWAAVRLTGGKLSPASNEAARTILAQEYPEPRQRLLQLMTFVAQLPEAQVR